MLFKPWINWIRFIWHQANYRRIYWLSDYLKVEIFFDIKSALLVIKLTIGYPNLISGFKLNTIFINSVYQNVECFAETVRNNCTHFEGKLAPFVEVKEVLTLCMSEIIHFWIKVSWSRSPYLSPRNLWFPHLLDTICIYCLCRECHLIPVPTY